MKTYTFSDFDVFGINPLTGESDKLMMRVLCDLSASGVALIQDYFGLPVMCQFEKNWNSMVGVEEAVASVLLERTMFDALMRFAILRENQYKFLYGQHSSYTCYNEHELETNVALQMMHEGAMTCMPGKLYVNPRTVGTVPSTGTRNEHQFTGRTE